MEQQAWTTAELEAFEVMELPTREAFTGFSCGLLTIDADICLDVDGNVDADLDLDLGDGDCSDSDGGTDSGGGKGGGGKC